jgi:hypothetical protein
MLVIYLLVCWLVGYVVWMPVGSCGSRRGSCLSGCCHYQPVHGRCVCYTLPPPRFPAFTRRARGLLPAVTSSRYVGCRAARRSPLVTTRWLPMASHIISRLRLVHADYACWLNYRTTPDAGSAWLYLLCADWYLEQCVARGNGIAPLVTGSLLLRFKRAGWRITRN